MLNQDTLDRASYVLSDRRRVLDTLHFFGSEMNRRYLCREPSDGTHVVEEEWDNLLIIDACRYDVFAEHHTFNHGHLEKRHSLGSDSWGFIQRNFAGETLHDTVYVSANPFTRTIPDGTFHAVHNLLNECWDESLETVQPGDVVDTVLSLSEKYDDKRIIVHFMQPHYPFLGPTGESIDSGGIVEFDENQNPLRSSEKRSVWTALRFDSSAVDLNAVWDAYIENFDIVSNHAGMLLEELEGRSVITSDHGNLFGEWTGPIPARAYGHPRDLFVDELTEVPWYVVDNERRPTKSSPPVIRDVPEGDNINDQLAALGYRER